MAKNTVEKITKKDVLAAVKNVVENTVWEDVEVGDKVVTADDILAYIDTTIAQIDAKAAKAKEKAAEKKAENDELADAVEAVLTDEYQTIADITEQIEGEAVTAAKVTARLTKLVKAGKANKTKVKTADGRTINGYAAGPAPAAEEE